MIVERTNMKGDMTMKMPLIAAHRGSSSGNIPCNSWVAFEAALAQGADIVEIDVSRSADGELFVFHPGTEPVFLLSDRLIRDMTAEEVRKLRFYNYDHAVTELGISTLDEVLEQLKDRCIVNIDKFPDCPAEIAAAVRRHGMQDQVLVKTNPTEEWFKIVEEVAPDLPYMVFARNEDTFSESLKNRNLRYLGTESLFTTEDAQIAKREYIDQMHAMGLKVWYNAIVFNYKTVHAAGHNDDISVAGKPDEGWGWLIDRGVDMIQTDWPGMLRQYMINGYHKKAIVL